MSDIVYRVQQSIDGPAPNGLTIDERREVVAEIERLRAWKAEAMEVLTNWDLVFEMIETRPQDLGRSKADVMADYIQRRPAAPTEPQAFDPRHGADH